MNCSTLGEWAAWARAKMATEGACVSPPPLSIPASTLLYMRHPQVGMFVDILLIDDVWKLMICLLKPYSHHEGDGSNSRKWLKCPAASPAMSTNMTTASCAIVLAEINQVRVLNILLTS